MDKPKFTRPFNLEDAKAGAPIGCANGAGAEVLRYLDNKLIGIQTSHTGTQFASEWKVDGAYCEPGHFNSLDLVMLPLGVIDGKPVFVGDLILGDSRGSQPEIVSAFVGMTFPAGNAWTWPEPAKVYPETQIGYLAFIAAASSGGCTHIADALETAKGTEKSYRLYRVIANAAIRNAVDTGQLVTKEEHEAALYWLGAALRPYADAVRAARDMAVAQAVRHSCVAEYDRDMRAMDCDLDLAAIVASVK